MDSCVYQPPDILKVQIYSFITEKKVKLFQGWVVFFFLYVIRTPLQYGFPFNFVLGQVSFPLTTLLLFLFFFYLNSS